MKNTEEMSHKEYQSLVDDLAKEIEERGFTRRFWSPYEQYEDRIGEEFTVIRRATEADDLDLECLPMWWIRFKSDNEVILAHPEEISAVVVTVYRDSSGLFSSHECDRDNLCDLVFPQQIVFQWFVGNEYPEKTDSTDGDEDEWDAFHKWFEEEYTADDVEGLVDFAAKNGYRVKRGECDPETPCLTADALVLEALPGKTRQDSENMPLSLRLYHEEGGDYWFEMYLDLVINGEPQSTLALIRPTYKYDNSDVPIPSHKEFEILAEEREDSEDMYAVDNPDTGKEVWALRADAETTMVPVMPAVCSIPLTEEGNTDIRIECRANPRGEEAVVGITMDGQWWQNLALIRLKRKANNVRLFVFDEGQREWKQEKIVSGSRLWKQHHPEN